MFSASFRNYFSITSCAVSVTSLTFKTIYTNPPKHRKDFTHFLWKFPPQPTVSNDMKENKYPKKVKVL